MIRLAVFVEAVALAACAPERDTARAMQPESSRGDAVQGTDPNPPGVDRLNRATYEELRALELSHDQVGRVLIYRESVGAFGSLDELDRLYGFSADDVVELKKRLARPEPGDPVFNWADRPQDGSAERVRRGIKYVVAFAGRWQARFSTLEEALGFAEMQAPRQYPDLVYVVKSSLWGKRLVTAYPQSRLAEARDLWNRWRHTGLGGG